MITPEQLVLYERLYLEYHQAEVLWRDYRRFLAKSCDHPEKFVKVYTWEHDDGYGKQSMNEGFVCTICSARQPYKTAPWHEEGDLEKE